MSTSRWGERLVRYPADLADRYRQAGLWGTRTITDELHAVAAAYPRRDAVVALDGRVTYRELDERTDVLAAGLAGQGLAPGDPVLFQVSNRLGAVLAWYGVLKAGLVPVCTLAAHRGHEIGEISRRVGAVAHLVETGTPSFDLVSFAAGQQRDHPTLRLVLVLGGTGGTAGTTIESLGAGTDPQTARKTVEEIQRGIDPDDVAVFQLSGGTTGVPKVIPRLHAEYWYNAAAYARSWGWSPDTRVAHLIPVIHNAGIVCAVHGPHSAGACLVLGTADLDVSLPLMARERATHVLLGHGHFKAIAEDAGFAAATASVTQVILSGTKVPPVLFDDLERRGLWSGQLFGMGEGLFLTTRPGAPREARATTVGTPLSPMDEIRILEPGTGTELPDGEVGELCCRGPYTLRGYLDAAARNAQAFTPDGFYRTGDLASVREIDGQRYVAIEGRIKDIINRGGEKINAEEVELLLLGHPRITAAAVVAMPDPRLGERTCAYVVVQGDPLTMAEIRQHFAGLQVAKYKWPERVEHLADLPRTLVGKTDKKRLRAEIAGKVAADLAANQPRPASSPRRHRRRNPVTAHRIGLIVPSSNVTVETEIPALLARHADARFSFHSSRMRMHTVSPEELRAMNAQRERCIDELADARVDALLYACLVAIMAQGPGEHRRTEDSVTAQLAKAGQRPAVLSSAGALVEALATLGVTRIALVTPYLRPLAEQVVAYLESEGFEVLDWAALEVGDNAEVGCIPGDRVMKAARGLDHAGADALVISACVQMPSLELISPAEEEFGLPVLSAATAGAYTLLRRLGLPAVLPGAGLLLAAEQPARSGPPGAARTAGSLLQSPS